MATKDTPKDISPADLAPANQNAPEVPVDPLAGLSEDNANAFVQDLLDDAETLRGEKETLLERIDDNRQTLRRIARTGHLSEKQAAAIKLWYPDRQKKGEETTDNGAAA